MLQVHLIPNLERYNTATLTAISSQIDTNVCMSVNSTSNFCVDAETDDNINAHFPPPPPPLQPQLMVAPSITLIPPPPPPPLVSFIDTSSRSTPSSILDNNISSSSSSNDFPSPSQNSNVEYSATMYNNGYTGDLSSYVKKPVISSNIDQFSERGNGGSRSNTPLKMVASNLTTTASLVVNPSYNPNNILKNLTNSSDQQSSYKVSFSYSILYEFVFAWIQENSIKFVRRLSNFLWTKMDGNCTYFIKNIFNTSVNFRKIIFYELALTRININ